MPKPHQQDESRKTYVIDTSVLLADPGALERFAEHDVVLPLVVLTELESKRDHPELGYTARSALRYLEQLRTLNGGLTHAIPVNSSGGTLRVEVNHVDDSGLPDAFRSHLNDNRILAVANNLAIAGAPVVVVTKDLPLRLKASVLGLGAEEYRNELASDDAWSGFLEATVDGDVIDELYAEHRAFVPDLASLPCHTGFALSDGSRSALGRLRSDKDIHHIKGTREIFGVSGRSAEQRVAIDVLLDESVGIVSLGGSAGTGKSVLALAAGLEAVLERETHKRIVVFRPLYSVGGQDLGFLPGDANEKMAPWAGAVSDALESICNDNVIEEVFDRGLLEVLPLTHIRGRTLTDTWVILDEAQQYEKPVLVTALSRLGRGSRVVLTHDIAQRDNLRVGRYDGVASVIESLKGNPLFAHITLTRSERSAIAALASSLLEAPAR
jgi:PhoH-like ATPase